MYKIKRLVKTGPPIEAEQMEPLKRNLDLPHKPPAKKKMTIAKVDTVSIFSRSRHACNTIAYLLLNLLLLLLLQKHKRRNFNLAIL